MNEPLKKVLRRYAQIFSEDRAQGTIEADIVMHVTGFLTDVLGYDLFSEITKELQSHERFCDMAVKLQGEVKFLIEVKPASFALVDRHIEHAEDSAARLDIRWIVLTNGVCWRLYRITVDSAGITRDLAFETSLTPDTDLEAAWNDLGLLAREKVRQGVLEAKFSQSCTSLRNSSVGDTAGRSPSEQNAGTPLDAATLEERLLVLKRLQVQGLITEEEYREEKKQLLDRF